MASVAVESQVDDPWKNAAAKRTAAIPKHSLFGTAFEVYDADDLESIKRINLKEHQKQLLQRNKKDKLKLPESIRSQLLTESDEYVARKRQEYEKIKESFNKTDNSIKEAEREALSFKGSHSETSRPTKLSKDAAQLARRMNRVGLNDRSSYNYDKYGKERKLPAHQYSLIGDILRPGNDFAARREKTDIVSHQNTNMSNNTIQTAIGRQSSARSASSPRAAIDIPANIKHQYGTRVCDNLLADEKVVRQTLEDQAKDRASTRKKDRTSITALEKQMMPEYEQLGNFMRQNVFPGYTVDHHISTTKSVFSDDVHLKRHPDPDKWRYQRDELSTWSEHNVLRDRMKKSWQELLDSQPKLQANWDRNARAPPKPILKDPAKPKQKAPPKPKETKQKDSEFEEIKFVTPPVTPPPEKVTLAPKKAGKDNEFWDYYDKSGNK